MEERPDMTIVDWDKNDIKCQFKQKIDYSTMTTSCIISGLQSFQPIISVARIEVNGLLSLVLLYYVTNDNVN